MKKKISLYLALIMAFNLIMPFARPIEVYAAPVTAIPPLTVDAPQNYLVPGGTSAIPSERQNGATLNDTATMYWDYRYDEGGAGDMYVLRFYDPSNGEKIELTTQVVMDANGTRSMVVNYDAYEKFTTASAIYSNYDKPTTGDDGADTNATTRPLSYAVYAPKQTGGDYDFAAIRSYFDNLPPREPGEPTDYAPRVNNRDKYTSGGAIGAATWTNTVNPDYYSPYTAIKPANDLPYMSEGKYLDRLAPSFTIPLDRRGGYSFRYKGKEMHFLYNPTGGTNGVGRFTFTTDSIQEGYVYDFQLEYYKNGLVYKPQYSNNTGGNGGVNAGGAQNGNDYFYVNNLFTGVKNFNVIPVAQNADSALTGAAKNNVDNTLPQFINKEPDAGGNYRPVYNTEQLEIMSTFSDGTDLLPGTPPTAMDIRFDMPLMYNDVTQTYDKVIPSNIPVNMSIGFLNSNDNTKTFQIELRNAQTMEELTGPGTEHPEERPANVTNPDPTKSYWYLSPENSPFDLVDGSLMRDAGNALNRMRLRVETTDPNMYAMLYSDVSFDIHSVAISGGKAEVSTRSANYGIINGYPVYTFPTFDFDYDEDRLVITVPPFNFNSVTRIGEKGYYYLLMPRGATIESIGAYSDGTENKLLELFSPPRDMSFYIIFSRNPIDASRTLAELWASGSVYFSQYVHYGPPPVITPAISQPNNFDVVDTGTYAYKLTPHKDAPVPAYEADLTFRLRWDVGLDANIQELVADNGEISIKYNLDYSFIPDKDKPLGEPPYNVITMQIRQDPASATSPQALQVKYTDTLGELNTAGLNDPDGDGWVPFVTRPSNPQTIVPTNVYFADIPFKTYAVSPYSGKTASFNFPNLYFMRVEASKMWASSIAEPIEPNLRNLAISNFDSMTLDSISQLAVPAPLSFNVQKNAEDGKHTLDVSYAIPGRAISQYLNSLYKFDPKITVNVYIGQFEEAIRQEFYRETYPAPGDVTGAREEIIQRRLDNSLPLENAFAQFTSSPAIDFTVQRGPNGEDPLQVLRGNASSPDTGVVRIASIPMPAQSSTVPNINVTPAQVSAYIGNGDLPVSFKITGLDENQRYYAFADLTIEQWASGAAITGTDTSDTSDLTTMDADITDGTGGEPSPQDAAPPAPENLTAVLDPALPQSSSIVSWNPVIAAAGSADVESKTEYEIIRIESAEMPESKLLPTLPDDINFENFFKTFDAGAPVNKVGWQTNGNTATMYNKDFGVVDNTGNVSFTYTPAADRLTLNDYTLSANKIYAYYVRTVKIMNVKNDPQLGDYPMRLVSSWNRVFLTTTPIDAPYDLQNPLEHPSYPELDGMTEAMLSWMYPGDIYAQVMSGALAFYYEIREGDGDWAAKTIPTAQWADAAMYQRFDDGTMKFFYKLEGLEPDKTYTVHVYLYDPGMGDKSPNTNDVPLLTAPDPGQYEEDQKLEDALDDLNDMLQEVLNDPYWVLSAGDYDLTLVVRPGEMFNGPLYGGSGSLIDIYNTGVDNVTVYIPSGVMEAANGNTRGFRLPYEDMDVVMPPGMISETYNDAIINMKTAMHNGEISDYFVRMTVNRSVLNEQIENMPPLSKQANINYSTLGTVNTYKDKDGRDTTFRDIENWDESIYDTAAKLVVSKIEDQAIRDRLLEEIRKDRLPEELQAYVKTLAGEIEAELLQDINRQMQPTGGILENGKFANVTKLDAPMYIVSKPGADSTYVNGYKNESGSWVPQPVTEQYNGQAITAATPGTYVLAGRAVNIPGIENVARGGQISDFTGKYGLEDYLGYDGVDLNQSATRQMVAGSVARLAGAPKTANPIAWVNDNLNVSMSSRGESGLVTAQEAAAMVMALYEQRTGESIDDMTIRNYQATAGMTGLNARYTQAVRAGFETGVLSGDFNPAGPVTINQLLSMLGALDGKVSL